MPITEMNGEFSFLKYSCKVLTDYWIAVRNSTFIGVSLIEHESCWSWAAYAMYFTVVEILVNTPST